MSKEKEGNRMFIAGIFAVAAWLATFYGINKGLYELLEVSEGINKLSLSQNVYFLVSLYLSYKGANYVGKNVGDSILKAIH